MTNNHQDRSEPQLSKSTHTNTFPEILRQLNISLVVSTYQTGKVIIVRADKKSLNTHFKLFNEPMGVTLDGTKIAIGTKFKIWESRNIPKAIQQLKSPEKYDACFVPRRAWVTGDVDVHEMAYINHELWFINTRFSCLCTLDDEYSFVPRWKPDFITAYDPHDRCHLNGLGVRDHRPKYATALGNTDTPNGWRENKANGGVLIDIETNETIVEGLSMPHSPRWYRDKLWVLDSGKGTLSTVDLATSKTITVAELPGFTRGVSFYENLAFIGLSQVRETAVFSGIPIASKSDEIVCGVWVVNIETGQTVAFLKFEDTVQEIFSVQVLPGMQFPELIEPGIPSSETNEQDLELTANSYVFPDVTADPSFSVNQAIEKKRVNNTGNSLNQEVKDFDQHFKLGNSYYKQGKLNKAVIEYQSCLQCKPDSLHAKFNLAVVLGDLGFWKEAIKQLQSLIDSGNASARVYNRLGFSYGSSHQLQKAIQSYTQAITLDADFAEAHFNLGIARLKQGDFKRGFTEYEWRWQTEDFTPINSPHPQWDGADIPEKAILIHTEQGAGDTIQFVRLIPLVKQKCRRVLLCCPEPLKELFSQIPEIDEILLPGKISLSSFDAYVPLMSLPRLLGTTIETIPNTTPYLEASSSRVSLPHSTTTKTKVGFVWAGSLTQKNDQNRSCPLEKFEPILSQEHIQFYSLQVGDRVQDLSRLPASIAVEDVSPLLHNYADTASVIAQLDLIISVDTSVAHLAGAIGKPVWTLLCHNPDWRWLLDRNDTPWYPTMRLFRQFKAKDWDGVMVQVMQALATFCPG